MLQLLRIGADPEVFVVDKAGTPVSIEGKLGGTKAKPLPMNNLPVGFNVQEDNVAAEYNIPACNSADMFDRSIFLGLRYIENQMKKQGLKLAIVDTLHFTPEQLATPHAARMGCEPDFNVWLKEMNPPPVAPKDFRTASGHVHFSWNDGNTGDPPHGSDQILVGRACDLFYGVPSILCTEKTLRRSLYGRAGAWRFKNYGGEYRTLPNFWLKTKADRRFVYEQATRMFNCINQSEDFFEEDLIRVGDDIQTVINDHDREGAMQLMHEFNIQPFPSTMRF